MCLCFVMRYFAFSNFAVILKRKREQIALFLLSYGCLVAVNVLWLFLAVPLIGLRSVIVVFPDHTQLLFIALFHRKWDFQNLKRAIVLSMTVLATFVESITSRIISDLKEALINSVVQYVQYQLSGVL